MKVTIIRHGDALGFMAYKPVEEKRVMLREELLLDIQVTLAARAAEELFLGTQTVGVGGDFAQVTAKAFNMLNHWGMDGSFYSTGPFGEAGARSAVDDPNMRRRIDQLLDQEYRKIKALLSEYSGAMHELAQEVDGAR